MKQLTAEQLQDNWNEFLGYIEQYITGDRKEKLLNFYKSREERFLFMPASAVEHYHSAYAGGYIEHVNRVVRATLEIAEMWQRYGSPLNCTYEELVFAALNHDLGKYGTDEEPYYVPNPSDWHRKNQGKIYEYNDNVSKMQVPDRSIFLLTTNGITITENEYIGIKIHDGMYDDANKYYLVTYGGWSQKLKSSLGYIVHQADMLAARVEFEEWRDNYREGAPNKVNKTTKPKGLSTASQPLSNTARLALDDIFGDNKGE